MGGVGFGIKIFGKVKKAYAWSIFSLNHFLNSEYGKSKHYLRFLDISLGINHTFRKASQL
jgi:hypothetical protein